MPKMKNYAGNRYGKIVITDEFKRGYVSGIKMIFWKYKCDCGNERWIQRANIGQIFSCGCKRNKKVKIKDMRGQRFGKLIVMDKFRRTKGITYWWCHCDCGNGKWIMQCNLKKSNSCGCVSREKARNQMLGEYGMATKKHIYCDYRKSAKYRKYTFQLDFETFIDITQQNCYYCGSSPKKVEKSKYNNGDFIYNGLDRINNKKGYEIDNVVSCCWDCNQMKNKMEVNIFLNQIAKICSHFNGNFA